MNLGPEAVERRVADIDHKLQLAATDGRDHLIAADLVIVVDAKDPFSGDWNVEGNAGLRQGRAARFGTMSASLMMRVVAISSGSKMFFFRKSP